MPDVVVDEDDVVPPDEAVVKVSAGGMFRGKTSWHLGEDSSIQIRDDGPNQVTVETPPFEDSDG